MHNEKISTSGTVITKLIAYLVATLAIIQYILYYTFEEWYQQTGTILFLVLLIAVFEKISVNIAMNKCYVLLNAFSGEGRAIFEGFHFKLPWEKIQYIIDLEAEIKSEVTETFPTTDASIKAILSVLSKPDSGEGESEYERSKKMLKHVNYTREAMSGMQETVAKKTMREVFAIVSASEAKRLRSEEIIDVMDFQDLEDLLAISVKNVLVKDIDYSKEAQDAKNSVFKAETIGLISNTLQANGYSLAEAKVLAPYMMESIKFEKKTTEHTTSFEVLEAVKFIIEKITNKGGQNA